MCDSGLMLFGGILAGNVQADPADDALAKLNELSRQAEQTTEAMHSAQLDLNNKLAAQQDAEAKHAADQAAFDTANAQLATFQTAVDKFAAAQYMGGSTSGMDAMLTADSPQRLIDQLVGSAGDGLRDVGADEELPNRQRPGGRGTGSVRQVGGRREDRSRAGRGSAR